MAVIILTDKMLTAAKRWMLSKCLKRLLHPLMSSLKGDRVPLLEGDDTLEDSQIYYHSAAKNKGNWIKRCFLLPLILLIVLFFIIFANENNLNNYWKNEAETHEIPNPFTKAFFERPEVAKNLDCEGYFVVKNQTENVLAQKPEKVTWKPPLLKKVAGTSDFNSSVNCADIFSRNYFPSEALSEDEKKYSIAFARIVYTVRFPTVCKNPTSQIHDGND